MRRLLRIAGLLLLLIVMSGVILLLELATLTNPAEIWADFLDLWRRSDWKAILE
jgi:hypothetical protein